MIIHSFQNIAQLFGPKTEHGSFWGGGEGGWVFCMRLPRKIHLKSLMKISYHYTNQDYSNAFFRKSENKYSLHQNHTCQVMSFDTIFFRVSEESIRIVVFCMRDCISIIVVKSSAKISSSFHFCHVTFGNFGLFWWVPEGRNMSAG